MRYVSRALLPAFAILIPSVILGQGLSITNYQFVSSQPAGGPLTRLTYRADIVNGATPWAGATATLQTRDPYSIRIVPGQNILTFPALPVHGQVTSTNTFSVLSTSGGPLDPTKISWTFATTAMGPVANAGPGQTVPVGTQVTVNGSGSTNPSGVGSLTYHWAFTSRPPGSAARLTSTVAVISGFTVDVPGSFVLTLTVSNGTASSSASVTISTSGTPPVANAGPNQFVNLGAAVQLDGSGSTDVDGNLLTYLWTMLSKPAGSLAVIDNPTAVKPTFIADASGSYSVQLVVNDGTSNSTPVVITISTNQPQVAPTAFAGTNVTVRHNSLVMLHGSGSDPQGLTLLYKWSLLSAPAGSVAALLNPNASNPTMLVDLPGAYVAQLIVNNGTADSAPATVTITTTDTPPVASAGSNQTFPLGNTAHLDGTGSLDVDGDPLTYSWSILSRPAGSTATLPSPSSATPTFTPDVAGTYVAQLIVITTFANSNPVTVTLTVTQPVIITLSPSPMNLTYSGGTMTITLSAPAGAGGVAINLLSGNPSAATVPLNAIVPENGTTTTVTVTPGTLSGSTTITAASQGLIPGSATVNYTRPVITLSPNPLNISASPGSMTVSLSVPAPAAGLVVNLLSTNITAATVPGTMTIPGNASSAAVGVMPGTASGSGTITASALGVTSGSLIVNFTKPILIVLPSNPVSLVAGSQATFPVSLSAPAAAPGVVITLVSSDTSKVKFVGSSTVTIPTGSTTPATQPTVSAVAMGGSTITASATGYPDATQQVNVTQTITFWPATVSLPFSSSTRFTSVVLTTGLAPAGGLTINLTSDNPAVASVPATVTIPAGGNQVQLQVKGVGAGTTTIHANLLPFIPDTTASVTVGN